MNWFVKWKLHKISIKANPDAAFVLRLEKELVSRIGVTTPWLTWGRMAVSTACIITVLGSGTGAYAYTSDEVVPDHPLYGMRQTIENVEMKLATTEEAKTHVEMKQLNRRIKEAQKLRALNRPLQAAKLEQMSQKVQALIKKVDVNDPKMKEEVRQAALHIEKAHVDLLEGSQEDLKSEEEKRTIRELIQTERKTIREHLQNMRQLRREQNLKKHEVNKTQ